MHDNDKTTKITTNIIFGLFVFFAIGILVYLFSLIAYQFVDDIFPRVHAPTSELKVSILPI